MNYLPDWYIRLVLHDNFSLKYKKKIWNSILHLAIFLSFRVLYFNKLGINSVQMHL